MNSLRVLTVTDLHQSRGLYSQLREAVRRHRPDLVCVVDALDADQHGAEHLAVEEAATQLADLSVGHLLFVGDHEGENWREFEAAWPHKSRPLVTLRGDSYVVGPLVVVGFPESKGGDEWLAPLMASAGTSGQSLWVMHQPPMGEPLAQPDHVCPHWARAVWRHRPMLVVSGHDQHTPLQSNVWKGWLGATCVINVGQTWEVLHFAVLDFYFEGDEPARAIGAMAEAFPWRKK